MFESARLKQIISYIVVAFGLTVFSALSYSVYQLRFYDHQMPSITVYLSGTILYALLVILFFYQFSRTHLLTSSFIALLCLTSPQCALLALFPLQLLELFGIALLLFGLHKINKSQPKRRSTIIWILIITAVLSLIFSTSNLPVIVQNAVRNIGIEPSYFDGVYLTTTFPRVLSSGFQGLGTFLSMAAAPYGIVIVLGAVLCLVGIALSFRAGFSETSSASENSLFLLCAVPILDLIIQSVFQIRSPMDMLALYPFFLASVVYVPVLLRQHASFSMRSSIAICDSQEAPPSEKILIRVSLIIFTLFLITHIFYWLKKSTPPSWDEAHYLSAAYQFYSALLSNSWNTVFSMFQRLLESKPPLLSVVAGLNQYIFGESLRSAMSTQILIFLAVGLSSYLVFVNIFSRALALTATMFLLSMPLVTGLTHHFYTESLLLVMLCLYVAILTRQNMIGWLGAIGLGIVAGLGFLTKSTFGVFAILPSLFCGLQWGFLAWRSSHRVRDLSLLFLKAAVIAVIAAEIALPWYSINYIGAKAHSYNGFWCASCTYPTVRSFFAMISAGPYFWQSILTLLAVVVVVAGYSRQNVGEKAARTFICLLLLAIVSFISSAVSINKAVRFPVAWLPLFAAGSVIGIVFLSTKKKSLVVSLIAAQIVCLLLVAHNSFQIFGKRTISFLDMHLFSSEYQLNIPNWFNDNSSLLHSDFNIDQLAEVTSRDAIRKFPQGAVALLTVDCLYLNHNLLTYLGRAGGPVWYLPWYIRDPATDESVKYVIMIQNPQSVCPGKAYSDQSESFLTKLRNREIDFQRIAVVNGIGETRYLLFRRQ